MGRISIPRAKYGPPAKTGVAKPPWPEYQTRKRRSMAGFGEAILSLGDRLGSIITAQLVQSEYAEGKALLEQRDNEFFQSAVDDPDYEKLPEKYSKESKKWQEEILGRYKTPGARNALKSRITSERPRMDATLNGIIKGKAQEDARRKLSDSIQGFIPSAGAIPEELELGIINATAAAQGSVESGLYSKDQAEEQVIFALMEDWPEVALKEIDASSLLPQRKLQLRSNAKTIIRNIENKKRIIEQETWEKTEAEAFNLLFDNELTDEWVRGQFNLGNMSKTDRDAYLSALSRPKEVKLNWDVYDNLLEMVEDYEKEKVTKDKVRLAITNALGKDIPETAAIRLRGKLDTIDKPDDPMNRSDVKRGLGVFEDLESAEISANKDEPYEKIREIRLKYQKKMDEFEGWIKRQEKLTGTDIQNKVAEMTEGEAEELAKFSLENMWNIWVQSPFGVGYRKIAGIKKEGKELLEPTSLKEFEDTVGLLDEEEAKAYYEKWKSKW